MFIWHFLHSSTAEGGKCIPTMVPTPALASSAYISSGPEVPPVIFAMIPPQRPSGLPRMMRGGSLNLAQCRYSGSSMRRSTTSFNLRGSASAILFSMYSCTMLSDAECTLNTGNPRRSAASSARLKLSPMTLRRTVSIRGLMRSSATLIGTPQSA